MECRCVCSRHRLRHSRARHRHALTPSPRKLPRKLPRSLSPGPLKFSPYFYCLSHYFRQHSPYFCGDSHHLPLFSLHFHRLPCTVHGCLFVSTPSKTAAQGAAKMAFQTPENWSDRNSGVWNFNLPQSQAAAEITVRTKSNCTPARASAPRTTCGRVIFGKCRGYWTVAAASIQNSPGATSVRVMPSEYLLPNFDSQRTRNISPSSCF